MEMKIKKSNNFHFEQRNGADMHCASVAQCTLGRVSVAMINKWLSNTHVIQYPSKNRAYQETLLIERL